MTISASSRSLALFLGAIALSICVTVLCGCVMRWVEAPEFFTIEEKRLSELIIDTQDPWALSGLYAGRAKLRVRADNPHPDYKGALEDFTASLNLNSKRLDSGELSDWIAVLSKLDTTDQESINLRSQYKKVQRQNLSLKSDIARLRSSVARLKANIAHLEEQEKQLRKSIEELQALELRMEQRRQRLN